MTTSCEIAHLFSWRKLIPRPCACCAELKKLSFQKEGLSWGTSAPIRSAPRNPGSPCQKECLCRIPSNEARRELPLLPESFGTNRNNWPNNFRAANSNSDHQDAGSNLSEYRSASRKMIRKRSDFPARALTFERLPQVTVRLRVSPNSSSHSAKE